MSIDVIVSWVDTLGLGVAPLVDKKLNNIAAEAVSEIHYNSPREGNSAGSSTKVAQRTDRGCRQFKSSSDARLHEIHDALSRRTGSSPEKDFS